MIYTFIKTLHLLALVFGAAANLGNVYILLAKGPHDLPAPGFVNALRKLYRYTALGAILVLWATGLLMIVMRFGWPAGSAFHLKLTFSLALLMLIGFVNLMAPRWAKRGGPPNWVASLHVAGARSSPQMRSSSSWRMLRVCRSTAASGSSSSHSAGSLASSRASAQRWRMPPESSCG